jgi:hypothetical protein
MFLSRALEENKYVFGLKKTVFTEQFLYNNNNNNNNNNNLEVPFSYKGQHEISTEDLKHSFAAIFWSYRK